jgi:hypothetical protein
MVTYKDRTAISHNIELDVLQKRLAPDFRMKHRGNFCTIEGKMLSDIREEGLCFYEMSYNLVLNYMLFRSGQQPEHDISYGNEGSALKRRHFHAF